MPRSRNDIAAAMPSPASAPPQSRHARERIGVVGAAAAAGAAQVDGAVDVFRREVGIGNGEPRRLRGDYALGAPRLYAGDDAKRDRRVFPR
jgi:hypothetical protein